MAEDQRVVVPRVKLGTQGLEVSKLGFGCAGLSGLYNAPLPEDVGISIIKEAFNRGVTFFDTSDYYGPHTNEVLVGKVTQKTLFNGIGFGVADPSTAPIGQHGRPAAYYFFDGTSQITAALKHLPRERVQLATKFGIVAIREGMPSSLGINGKPEYVRACCEASLKRLDVDYVDLYYQHRIDTSTPIEETMEELVKLVQEGKIKYIGLSEASPDTIRRAHAVHPISALQMEWSLLSRDIEQEIVPLCKELGIGIVPYSPIARGFFAGRGLVEPLYSNTVLKSHPRFSEGNLAKNKVFYDRMQESAQKHGCTPAQLALAWVNHQGDDVAPIPGTTKIKNLEDNIGSLGIKLTKEDLKELSDAIPVDEVAGSRSWQPQQLWMYADTPPRN